MALRSELMRARHSSGSDLTYSMKFQHVIVFISALVNFVSIFLDVFYVQLCERIVVTRDSLFIVRDNVFKEFIKMLERFVVISGRLYIDTAT